MGQALDDAPYDRFADAYRRWWAPVIAPPALRLLDRLTTLVDPDAALRFVDVGVGTGTLALGALERWRRASIVGVDPSRRMMQYAAAEAARRGKSFATRLQLLQGDAERLPLDDATADGAISSFVIQLVSSRAAMLRELHRVVRPGGRVAVLTWQVDDEPYAPEETVLRTFEEMGVSPASGSGDPRSYSSPRAAAAEFRRAAFGQVHATREWIDHPYTPQSYLGVLEHWIEDEAFAALPEAGRVQLRRTLLDRLAGLRLDELRWRRPLVSVVAVRR